MSREDKEAEIVRLLSFLRACKQDEETKTSTQQPKNLQQSAEETTPTQPTEAPA